MTGQILSPKPPSCPELPEEFLKLLDTYDYRPFDGLSEALLHSSSPVSVRTNLSKKIRPASSVTDRVPWCPNGIYLPERPKFTFYPELHQGLFYVQDASSMAVTAAIRHLCDNIILRKEAGGVTVLDACAAPGGKSTAIADCLPEGSALIANEYDYRRADILAENLAKWGSPAVAVTRGDTARFSRANAAFDIITIDAPCSGEGMMRKDPVAISQWSPSLVAQCARRQKEIIDNLWPALRPGGALIYSTCTFNASENEDIVEYICSHQGAEAISIPELHKRPDIFSAIQGSHPAYRFIPGKTRGEGLFMAVIIKDITPDGSCKMKKKSRASAERISPAARRAIDYLKDHLNADINLRISPRDDEINLATPALTELMEHLDLSASPDFLTRGVSALKGAGKDWAPTQQLAMMQGLTPDTWPLREADYETAMSYLRGEALTGDPQSQKGFNLLTYRNKPLGFVKNLGNRANNLYPKGWRVMTRADFAPVQKHWLQTFLNYY